MDPMIMDRYFRQLNERGRVVITFDDKDFLEVFIKSCREKNISVRSYKRKYYFEVRKYWNSVIYISEYDKKGV